MASYSEGVETREEDDYYARDKVSVLHYRIQAQRSNSASNPQNRSKPTAIDCALHEGRAPDCEASVRTLCINHLERDCIDSYLASTLS